jgi:anthranilate phosphoribosyltransferase
MEPKHLFEHLIAKKDLNSEQMEAVILACMSGQWSDSQIAAFLVLMRMKGETVLELTTAAKIMLRLARPLVIDGPLIDIVGTGGDGANTFNVSTAASFVVAAAGIPVAKHGNRSVSSRSGSADVLEEAGFFLNLSDEQVQTCIQECGLVFLYAPRYHPALLKARVARQDLGIRTLFNLLGPLINPARVKRQIVGVFASHWLKPLASVLVNLGSERVLVVHSQDGLDEFSSAAPTNVVEYAQGQWNEWVLNPEEYGIHHTSLEELVVSSPQQSMKLIDSVFAGAPGAARDMVVLNAAAALYCAHDTLSFHEAVQQAKNLIDSGKAAACFNQLRALTQTFQDTLS